MAPSQVLLSPAELSYVQTSLLSSPPIRPDGRSPTQFRPLVAETDILPAANGSARICFADGTEAVVGVKAEVQKSSTATTGSGETEQEGVRGLGTGGADQDIDMDQNDAVDAEGKGSDSWLEITVEIPGFRDDDQMPVFLASMLSEALLADGRLRDRLYINTRFHWVLYIDILLLSAPLSYPLPLLSLTTHLAMLQTKLPALVSEKDEDPLFNDDWDAATSLYPSQHSNSKPPVTLLVMGVGENIFFDATEEELAVADALLAVSVAEKAVAGATKGELTVVALRSIDPPSRRTNPGIPDSMNTATGGTAPTSKEDALAKREAIDPQKVWRPPRGGIRRSMISSMIKSVVEKGGVGWEVIDALEAVER
ncbi:ribosomal protein S5 domain 2-type protein [Elsinoe ampelina]|uniref:Ribosomal RNA-processing protein 42 n=1 Tax=Elsinoe ampelina TaxID=302913 RepID=A0A6A6GBK8_9PEZI|nr:ribosomal protein S5 domain 2-type protein [Elsinoe ampelina]